MLDDIYGDSKEEPLGIDYLIPVVLALVLGFALYIGVTSEKHHDEDADKLPAIKKEEK